MCLIAVSYGFLIRTFPVSGGEYAYTFSAFGRTHAFVCGWFLTLGYISIGLNGFYVSASRLLFAMGRARTVPSAFSRLTPQHRTPATAIWFVTAVCLIAPWFGREALLWVVDMSAIGVTIAYTYTCLSAYTMFRWSGTAAEPDEPEGVRSSVKKVLAALGAATGVGFFLLLMVPGSPAQLGTQSLVALGVWVVLGLAFFLSRRAESARTSDEEMRYLILRENTSIPTGARD